MNEGKATRYHRLRRRTKLLAASAAVLVLLGLLVSGASVDLRDAVARQFAPLGLSAGWRHAGMAAVYAATAWGLIEVVQLPVWFFQGLVLDRRYAVSRMGAARWAYAHLATVALSTFLAMGTAAAVCTALRVWPAGWWAVCAALFGVVTLLITGLAPICIIPLLYRIRSLDSGLTARLGAVAAHAGAPPLRVETCAVAQITGRAQATLVGLGPTRRVLVSDTLLADYSDEEIEGVLAHELGHYVHRDVWSLMAFKLAVAALALLCGGAVVTRFGELFELAGPSDIAGLPLMALGAGMVVATAAPFGHALSRRHEQRADLFAIRVTRSPEAFVSGLRRLGEQNLAEERPSRLVELLWHTHPPLFRRLAAARLAVATRRTGEGSRRRS